MARRGGGGVWMCLFSGGGHPPPPQILTAPSLFSLKNIVSLRVGREEPSLFFTSILLSIKF